MPFVRGSLTNPTMENEKVKKVLYNEVSLAIGAIALISSFIFWVTNPQKDLQLSVVKLQTQLESNETIAAELAKIKNNDLHEIQLRMDRIEERQIEELKAISRLEALMSRR